MPAKRRKADPDLKKPPKLKIEDDREEKPVKSSVSKSVQRKSSQTGKSRSAVSMCWGTCRWIILFILIPPFLNYASLHQEATHLQPPGELYDIGHGQKLFLGCQGKGKPTVILDAPTGMSSDVWVLVQQALKKETKVCVYDRAGIGYSDRPRKNYTTEEPNEEGEEPQFKVQNTRDRWMAATAERMVDDLHHLVTYSSQQEKPFILVGSELGGLVARFYSQIYESDVIDLVLVDPLVEDLFSHDGGIWGQFWFQHLIPSLQTMQLAAAVGFTRLALLVGLVEQPMTGDNLPEDVIKRQKYLMCSPRHLSSSVDEHHFINETFSQIRIVMKVKPFPSNVSVTVITGNYYDEQLPSTLNKAWAKSQQHLISQLHPGSNHIVVNGADHTLLYKQPKAIIEPVRKLIRKYKAKLKLSHGDKAS